MMGKITINVPDGYFDDVPDELKITSPDDLLDALRDGHDLADVAKASMRDEVGKPEGDPVVAALTRIYTYFVGRHTTFGRVAREGGLRSERMGYADDPVALRARDEAAWQRTCLEQENLLVRVAESGRDYRSLLKQRPTNERLDSNVKRRLAERELKQAA